MPPEHLTLLLGEEDHGEEGCVGYRDERCVVLELGPGSTSGGWCVLAELSLHQGTGMRFPLSLPCPPPLLPSVPLTLDPLLQSNSPEGRSRRQPNKCGRCYAASSRHTHPPSQPGKPSNWSSLRLLLYNLHVSRAENAREIGRFTV